MMRWKNSLACAAVGAALTVAGCNRTDSVTDGREAAEAPLEGDAAARTDSPVGTTGTTQTVPLSDIVAQPDKYFGRRVTVVADVEEVFGPRAFALDEDALLAGGIDNDLLVLSRQAGSLAPIDDQWMNNKVRVTGTVGRMTVVEAEREIGWDLDPQLEIEIEKRGAILIADSVERTEDGDDAPAER